MPAGHSPALSLLQQAKNCFPYWLQIENES
jgi:hypothetical protein